jgi:hypothetical protein
VKAADLEGWKGGYASRLMWAVAAGRARFRLLRLWSHADPPVPRHVQYGAGARRLGNCVGAPAAGERLVGVPFSILAVIKIRCAIDAYPCGFLEVGMGCENDIQAFQA